MSSNGTSSEVLGGSISMGSSDLVADSDSSSKMRVIFMVFLYLLVPGALLAGLRRLVSAFFASTGSSSKHGAGREERLVGRFPGPKQYPVVGRVHDLPRFFMWKKFKEWADEFGPIYQTSMLGQKFVVISDEKIARELLVRKGNKFSGRPQIRALINHKAGPVYSALMDRHGEFFFFWTFDWFGFLVSGKRYEMKNRD